MKRTLIFSLIFLSAFTFLLSFKKKNMEVKASNGFAVVELFTSEGCSSCPPADAVVADLQKEFPNNVFVLGFHVDYWDYIGWKDAFSNALFTKRQQEYAEHFALSSIYTPQVVVNGEKEMVGSNKNKLHSTVETALSISAKETITLTDIVTDKNNIFLNYSFSGKEKSNINFALVQLNADSDVKRGENRDRQLHHINVVRDLKTMDVSSGKIKLTMPTGLTSKDVKVIAYAQEKETMKVVAVASLLF
jgi:hypothetical protein